MAVSYNVGDVVLYGAVGSTNWIRILHKTADLVVWEGVDSGTQDLVTTGRVTFDRNLDAFRTDPIIGDEPGPPRPPTPYPDVPGPVDPNLPNFIYILDEEGNIVQDENGVNMVTEESPA